jgi:hypothetical protein
MLEIEHVNGKYSRIGSFSFTSFSGILITTIEDAMIVFAYFINNIMRFKEVKLSFIITAAAALRP